MEKCKNLKKMIKITHNSSTYINARVDFPLSLMHKLLGKGPARYGPDG